MLPYLTPERFRSMGFGTTDPTDEDLVAIIARATLAVDRYCSIPMTPARYSFRGGSVVNEEHSFRLGDGLSDRPTHVVWPRSTPLRSVSQMRVYVTNTQYIEFATGELFVTHDRVAVTSLALTSVGLFGVVTLPLVGLTDPICKVSYEYGYEFESNDEYLIPTEGKTFQAQNQFWTADDVTVKKNGVEITTGFTIDRVEGKIIMDTAQTESDSITASYGYSMPLEIAMATGLTVAKFIGDKQIAERGMTGIESLRVGEIEMTRPTQRARVSGQSLDLPNEAKQLLDGLHFMTIRS